MSSQQQSLLQSSVSSLHTSLTTLTSSLAILDTGIHDLPRLSRVLSTTRHFELLPESTLLAAQQQLLSEIVPEVEGLLARVEGYVERLERKEAGLKARWELQRGRLSRGMGDDGEEDELSKGSGRQSGRQDLGYRAVEREKVHRAGRGKGSEPLTAMEELKMKQMRQKKERLSYAVERLTLQAQQRERQLRKSIAPQRLANEENE